MKSSETPQKLEYDDNQNLIPEDYHSLKKTSAEIQKYSKDGLDHDSNVLDGVIDKLDDFSSGSVSSPSKRSPLDYKDQNSKNAFNVKALQDAVYDTEMDRRDVGDSRFQLIMTELKNHNHSSFLRKLALHDLMELTKEGTLTEWEENFQEVLLLLNDTIGDSNGSIRALALRVLCELMQHHPYLFHGFVEMTVLKILASQNDSDQELYIKLQVIQAAEECSATAARCFPPGDCVRTLTSIIKSSEVYRSPVQQAAIKMMTKLVEHHSKNVVTPLLPEIMPALLEMQLLNLYIERAQQTQKSSSSFPGEGEDK